MSRRYFQGKTVLITGASSGIGRGAAIEFANQGANLVLGGRNIEELTETKNECIKAGLTESQCSVTTEGVTEGAIQKQLIDIALTTFGKLNVLVNNAGIFMNTFLSEMKMDDFDEIHNVNLKSVIGLTLMALPHLIKTKGKIVNVSSNVAWYPITGMLAYSVSKAGLDMFTKSLAFEVAPQGVRVNSVKYECLGHTNPFGRNGQVNEVADCILFLASDNSSFITGQIIAIDGGSGFGGVKM